MKVNDGKGIFDNEGVCDQGILIVNDAIKDLFSGNYVAFCDKMTQVTRIFANLKTGIQEDRESREATIEELKRINKELQKDGADNGGN